MGITNGNGNKTMLNLGSGMGMNNWEWEGMALKKTFLLISNWNVIYHCCCFPCMVQYHISVTGAPTGLEYQSKLLRLQAHSYTLPCYLHAVCIKMHWNTICRPKTSKIFSRWALTPFPHPLAALIHQTSNCDSTPIRSGVASMEQMEQLLPPDRPGPLA